MSTLQDLYNQAFAGWAEHFAGDRIHCMRCGHSIELPVHIHTLVPEVRCYECGSAYLVDPVLASITFDTRTTWPEHQHTIAAAR